MPAYFIYTGLNTKLSLIFDPTVLAVTALVLVVSFASKFGAIGLVARSHGMGWREAGAMGALANARGRTGWSSGRTGKSQWAIERGVWSRSVMQRTAKTRTGSVTRPQRLPLRETPELPGGFGYRMHHGNE
jgi:hypothetical protein